MLRIFVAHASRDFATDMRISLMAEMNQVSRQMILLLLRQFRHLGFNFCQTHDQTIAGRACDASW